MHICIVGSSKEFFSGISAYTILMSNILADRGHKVSVILMRKIVPLCLYPGRDRVGKGSYLLDFNNEIDVYNGMDWYSPKSWISAGCFLRKQKPDALIMHWWTSSIVHMELFLAMTKLLHNKKTCLILEMHEVADTIGGNTLPLRLYSQFTGSALINLCDALVAHSDEAKHAIIQKYNVLPEKIQTIPLGPYNAYNVPSKDNSRENLKFSGFVILFFGMIRRYKGVPVLIKAFEMLMDSIKERALLVIAGEDWGDDLDLEHSLKMSPYRKNIVFCPNFIEDNLVPQYFAAADIVVMPYLRSCGSGVLNLALAQGKYIISSDISAMRESIKSYQGASFFPAGNSIALSERLIEAYRLWQNNEIHDYYEYSENSWELIMKKHESLLTYLSKIKFRSYE